MPDPDRVPKPPGPHPPVVRPAFDLVCEYCREPNKGPGQRHRRISHWKAKTFYECWNCWDPETRKASVFTVLREDKLREASLRHEVRTRREST